MSELSRQSTPDPGGPVQRDGQSVTCWNCGAHVGEFPNRIAVELNEADLVTLHRLALAAGEDAIGKQLRGFQLADFRRWHG